MDLRWSHWSFTQAIPQTVHPGPRDAPITQRIVNAASHVIFQVYLLIQALSACPSRARLKEYFLDHGNFHQAWAQVSLQTLAILTHGRGYTTTQTPFCLAGAHPSFVHP